MEAHQLGSVDKAVAPERDEVRLRIEPPRERRGPFLRASQVVQLLACLDDCAVDDAGHDRRDLAGDHRGHRLVEQRDAALDIAHGDQGLPAAEPAECRQVAIAEPVRDGGDPLVGGERGRRVARHLRSQRLHDEEPPALGAVVAGFLHETRRPREPATRLGHLVALDE
jgi:hypothetical protein